MCAGDVTRDGAVNPVDLKTRLTGRLHLRLANIGHMSDLKSSKLSNYACLYYQSISLPLTSSFLLEYSSEYLNEYSSTR